MMKKIFLCTIVILCSFSSVFADWPSEIKIEASDGMDENTFGHSVSIDGDVCVVGAYRDNETRGAVYVYRFDGSDWVEEQKLTASDEFVNNNCISYVSCYSVVVASAAGVAETLTSLAVKSRYRNTSKRTSMILLDILLSNNVSPG